MKQYLLMILAVLAALFGFYNHARKTGERAEQARHQTLINNVKREANYVEEVVNRIPDVAVRNGMRKKWTRSDM